MSIKFTGDEVEYLFKAGKDYVRGTMPRSEAEKIADKGKPKRAKRQGFNVRCGDFFFKTTESDINDK